MEVTCYWIIISLNNQSHAVSKRNRLFGPKSGFLKARSYNWWIQVLLKDVIVQWCNDLYLRFLLQTRGQNKITLWLRRLTSLTWQPKDWLTAVKRWSPLEPEWSHWVQMPMPMDVCLHGHTTTSQRWGRDLAGLKERDFFFFFMSFECVDHWRCQTCVQCTKFPPLWRWSRWRQSCGVTSLHSRQRLKRIEEQDLLMPTGLSVMYYLSSDCQKGRSESYPQLKIWLVVI